MRYFSYSAFWLTGPGYAIDDNIEKKMYSGLVFLDLAKAFYTVKYQILLQNLSIMVT